MEGVRVEEFGESRTYVRIILPVHVGLIMHTQGSSLRARELS